MREPDDITWPIHGPQALARTTAPTSSNTSLIPSRSIVARICSEPGVQRNGIFERERRVGVGVGRRGGMVRDGRTDFSL
jgi:hypothetical protein